MTDEKHVLKATAATLLVSKLVHRLLDLVSIVGMFVAFLGAVARAGYDAGMWWKTAHTSGYTNAELLYDVGIANQQTGLLGLQQILDEALDWPAWIGLLIAGVILLAINAMAKAKLRDVEQRLAWEKVWPVEPAPAALNHLRAGGGEHAAGISRVHALHHGRRLHARPRSGTI